MKNHFSNYRRTQQQEPKSNGRYLIDMRGVTKRYETAAGFFTALNNIDLQIEAGKFIAIVGKSTLLNMLTTDGEVEINGTAATTLTEDQIATWRGRNIGVAFQFFQLMPTLTVIENVMMPMDFCNVYPPRQRRQRALALLEQVGVADQADLFPAKLSGGQQQRVGIARANDPPILVANEPPATLTHTADDVLTLFQSLADSGKTVIMVTHERGVASCVSRVVTLVDGEIVRSKPRSDSAIKASRSRASDCCTSPTISSAGIRRVDKDSSFPAIKCSLNAVSSAVNVVASIIFSHFIFNV